MIFRKTATNHLLPVLFACLLATSLVPAPARSAEAGPSNSNAAPNFELPDLNGSKVALASFKGQKPVLIYFWATWCPHCLAVRPQVIKLRKETAQGELAILGVNVGGNDSLARLKKFEEANPAPYTVLYDAEGKSARSFKVFGIPHFILVDKSGTIKYSGNEMPRNPIALLK